MAIEPTELTRRLRHEAQRLGFELFGVAPVRRVPEIDLFLRWLDEGYAAEMRYLQRNADRRADPQEVVPGADSVIVCGKIYHTDAPLSTDPAPADRGWISRYAWGDDYHDLLRDRIRQLYEFLLRETDGAASGRYYVDTGPVLEKVWGKYAGLGWIGKNTCLINERVGSFFFLAVIITDVRLVYDAPPPDRCGTCTRCIDACPTDALRMPYVLDAGRCISYLTIELKNEIPEEFRSDMGRHLFGCDICQDVCPWNARSPVSLESAFQARPGAVNPSLRGLLALDEEGFRRRFRKSPVKRSKWRGLMRNALIAAGNSGDARLAPQVRHFAGEEDDLLAGHAQWALNRLAVHSNSMEPHIED